VIWPVKQIGEICQTTQGVQLKKSETKNTPYEGCYRYLYIADFMKDSSLSYVDDIYENKKVTENDLVMANTGSPGRVFKGKKGILSNNLFKISFDRSIVDRNFLYLYLSSKAFQNNLQKQMKGGIQKHLGHATIARQQLPLPPLEEQKRIAAILDKADAIRRKRQQAIQLADDFLRSVFLDMFGDPVTNPKGWQIKSVGELLNDGVIKSVQDGNHGNDHPKVKDFVHEGIPFIAANVVRRGKVLFDKCYYLDQKWLKKLRIGFAKPRDVLLTHKGTLGLTAVLDSTYDTYIFSPQTTYYRLDESKLLPEYLSNYFKTDHFQRLLKKEGKQSTRAYIGITRQKDILISVPDMKTQKKFLSKLILLKKIEQAIQSSVNENDNLFKSLSQKAFAGEL
jgi:type I restriction enzyme S subunit